MRKFIYLFAILCVVGCECIPNTFETTEFNIDYSFYKRGSMTRSSEEVYGKFYSDYILSKKLTPATYNLIFINSETGVVVDVVGKWNTNKVQLPEGVYTVLGESAPKCTEYCAPSDTVYLSFETTASITKETQTLDLVAAYNSFLIMFNADTYSSVSLQSIYKNGEVREEQLNVYGNVYAKFLQTFEWSDDYISHHIVLTTPDGTTTSVHINNDEFEKGCYYYFNDTTYGFDIPKMQPGI